MSKLRTTTAFALSFLTSACVTQSINRLPASDEYVRYLNGTHTPKEFLSEGEVPKAIRASASSVRVLCRDEIKAEKCLTITAVGKPSIFVTNKHALKSISLMTTYMCLQQSAAGQDLCKNSSKYFSINPDGTVMQVNPVLTLEGEDPTNLQEQMQDSWDPRKHLNINRAWDLVALRIDELRFVQPLMFSESSIGEEAYVIGFPTDPRLPLSRPQIGSGHVTFRHSNHSEGDFLGTVGMSGGPVVNKVGALIGIFWGKTDTLRERAIVKDAIVLRQNQKYYRAWEQRRLLVPQERSYYIDSDLLSLFFSSMRK